MGFDNYEFQVEFTEECIEEIVEIYDYISTQLKENEAAKRLIYDVAQKVLDLSENPELYMKIGKVDRLYREYRRMVVKNFVVLYTIDYEKKKIFVSRMIYGRKNYLN